MKKPNRRAAAEFTSTPRRIFAARRVMLCVRYPTSDISRSPNHERRLITMSSKNSNKLNIPEAKAAKNKFKMEAASEVDVPSSY